MASHNDSPPHVRSLPPKSYKFPRNHSGRSCKYAWFEKFTWLSYDYERDVVFCHLCQLAFKETGEKDVAAVEQCFIRNGFNNWKKGIEKFQRHEKSLFHCLSASRQLSREKGIRVVQLLSQHRSRQQEEARQAVRAIVSSVRYLCRTGQALQGQTKDDGNLLDLLDERSQDVPALKKWLEQRDKWLSSDIQNELIEIMAHTVQRDIIKDIQCSPFYGIIADGTTVVTGNDQFTFCVRWVDGITLEVREEFLGMYNAPDSRAETLYKAVRDMIFASGLGLP
ncbi:hypothetical protein HPB48_020417 [Haemaphysalis longicornis]|uniref:TTF-type domain-containing protein n=1 Tax=Haemaphysalis longicornis TaxID=44386 RepID=A0A9J6GZ96_HAELO|nr:hypothetical protein HPB48_020417 [Haemaphysalis longicornis]